MKHNLRITILLLVMFILTQLIGIYVVDHYSKTKIVNGEAVDISAPSLPYGMEPPEEADIKCEIHSVSDFFRCTQYLYVLIMAFIVVISLMLLFSKLEIRFILKLWFFVVVVIALGISLTSILPIKNKVSIIALAIALPLAYIKIYKKEFLIHNLTELLVYPGIAAVFVPILNLITIIILLILISAYDIWAVWHSGIMQKMAKYQIDKLNIFSGFFIPYADEKMKKKIREWRKKYRKKKISLEKLKSQKFRINVAILGGGDIIFPIIAAGVMLKTFGLYSAFFALGGAVLGLSYLFFFAKRKKFYPAMPFITAGIFAGMIASWLIL